MQKNNLNKILKNKIMRKLINFHYSLYSFLNKIILKKDNYIFIYDSQFMKQNCWALYKYLIENNYGKNYRIYYYSEKYNNHYDENLKKGIIDNPLKGWFLYLRSKYVFFENHKFKFSCRPGKKQIAVYLTHGMPFKNYGYLVSKPDQPYENDYTYLLMTSKFYIPIMKRALGCSNEQIYIGGMPRCDQLFNKIDISSLIPKKRKNILWMPTFRNSSNILRKDSDKDFPILEENNIEELDMLLNKNEIQLIIKPHPLQNTIPWLYNKRYKNIKIIFNEDLEKEKIELYEMIGNIDMLLTDYSSVYSEFLLTQKPIVFVIDDLENYRENRGFTDERLLEMLPGPIIKNYNEFTEAILSIEKIERDYKEERKKIQEILTPYSKSGSFSKDLCDFLKIKI